MRDRILDALIGPPETGEVALGSLMPRKVNRVLLVTSLYDSYTFIEDGRLSELLFSDYLELNLRATPSIERVSTAEEALARLRAEPFDLVISMMRVGDMDVREFGRSVRAIDAVVPVALLACNNRELSLLQPLGSLTGISRVFVWQGDVRLFLAIIKLYEDQLNAWHDAETAGVKSIVLVEDSAQFYSSYLPMLYTEILKQSQALMADGVNRMQRMMRMRARPKILLATSWEEALELCERYREHLLGMILDAAFPRAGRVDPAAGPELARIVRERTPEVPILIQSGSVPPEAAAGLEFAYLNKTSPSLLAELRQFIEGHLGFGEFVFRLPGGSVATRSSDLQNLAWAVEAVPDVCLLLPANQADLIKWLMARTEFDMAETLRGIFAERSASAEEVRARTLTALRTHQKRARAGVVAEFSTVSFEGNTQFMRIGQGSLGGKGRGLAFVNSLLSDYRLEHRFPGVRIFVPPTAVVATGVFDQFMESSGLLEMALQETDDARITRAFQAVEFPADLVETLWAYLQWVRHPLAVRSSSLLEDASYQPFAGIYATYMIPNNDPDTEVRLAQLLSAIKMVYASTYHADARAYMRSTPNRLEEEKMAVIIQEVVGRRHDHYVYPSFAGVARSFNFYPIPEIRADEGLVSVALGMGKTVVDGGKCIRFCPAHPRKPMQSPAPHDFLETAQRSFLALDLGAPGDTRPYAARKEDPLPPDWREPTQAGLVSLDLAEAERHGTLAPVGSVYSADNEALFDGISRPGVRLVSMAGVLKHSLFPLPEVLSFLLKVGSAASSCPVDIEFAVNLPEDLDEDGEFGFLQIRPLVMGTAAEDTPIEGLRLDHALIVAHKALGNGFIRGVRDVVYVRRSTFDRAHTAEIAREIAALNARLAGGGRPYLLAGPGRWGSSDPWLGIPVKWREISGARCIVETDLLDIHVDPSQGSHFFQNLVSFGIAYLTVDLREEEDLLDYEWLDAQPAAEEGPLVRHVTFDVPLEIALSGRRGFGVAMKPGRSLREP